MPIATRTFRVFVSSTFEDLKEERNALQREVFPKLRALCEQHGARFQAIDLRWGVRDEAALDQQTVEICLREIRRCQATGVRPNFIVLLGDRYGWQPLPARIPTADFDALLPHIPAGDARVMAEHWYRLDGNAVPPEYCLQPRTGEFVTPTAWNPAEQTLREALAMAARAAGLPDKDLIKYEASATHQEILAGLGETEADRQHVFGYFRRPTGETDARLVDLKSYLRDRVPGNIADFDPGDTTALCDAVYDQLRQVIEAEVKRFEDRPALDLEVEAHDRFAEERCRIFIGRLAVLDTIADYIRGPERRPLVLHGESGSGKSAVMAKASERYQGPGRVIRRFIGASPESASGHALLTSLCRQIAPGETPVDYAQLENALRERLSVAIAEQPLVLFIDALDQLAASDPARDVTWLPSELLPDVKVIVSTTDFVGRLSEGLHVRLERMARPEGGQALDGLLQESRRTLQPWQCDTVLEHFERCGLPLYLKLAAEESTLWKSYTPPNACALGEGVAGVIGTLFDRLASNANHGPTLVERSLGYLAAARHGLTEDEVLDVLTADDAVWSDFDQRKHHDVNERRLPVVVWSRLSLDLEPYLTERAAPGGTVITFYHRQLSERVTGRFLAGAELQARHADLARHFSAKPAWLDEGRKVPNARRSVELVFQQWGSQRWTEAQATLFDSQFLFAKCAAGMVLDLDADYQALLQDAPESSLPSREALRLIHGALRLSMHVVAQDPTQFASQMVGRLLAHRDTPGVAKLVDEVTAAAARPWLRPLHPCLDSPGGALWRTLEGHSGPVRAVALTADGRRAVSASVDRTLKVWDLETGHAMRTLKGHSDAVNSVAVTADGKRAISASEDKTLRVWDLETGRALFILEGHDFAVRGVAVTPDGKQAVSASLGRDLRVWDPNTGLTLRTLEGHSGSVNAVAVTADGKRAVSGSYDNTVKVWDLETGSALRTLEGHSSEVSCVAMTPDGGRAVSASHRAVSVACDDPLIVWDLDTGRALRTLEGHSGSVKGVAVTPDGRRAVSASFDGTLKIWELDTGRALRTLEGHSGTVNGVAVTSDSKRAVSASEDKTLKVWDLESSVTACKPERHSDGVNGLATTQDGKRVVSASRDGTLKVWDPMTGRSVRALEGHSSYVLAVAVTADGKRAVSASWDCTLKVWELGVRRWLRFWKPRRAVRTVNSLSLCVAVTPNGKRAISALRDYTLRVWDLETGHMLRTLEGHSGLVRFVVVTADGKGAISGSDDKTLRVWDLETGHTLQTLDGHAGPVWGAALMPDGMRVVSVSGDKTLKVWDLGTGRELQTLEGDSSEDWGVAVTADGKRVVTASRDKTLRVWDMKTGVNVTTFYCDGAYLCCACAAPNLILAGDGGGRVYFLALEE